MPVDQWSQENEWLNAFTTNLVSETHGYLRQLSVDIENAAVNVCGTATSYHAVQLAIYAAQSFSRRHGLFAQTILSLRVDDRIIDLTIQHTVSLPKPTTTTDTRQRELTLVS